MEINEMNLTEVEARLAEMDAAMEIAESPIEGFEDEKRSLLERKAELAEIEQRKKTAEALNNGEIEAEKTIEIRASVPENVEEKKMFTPETKEYRDAFFAMLKGNMTPEQRDIFADNTTFGDGVALPVAVDTAIWDQLLTKHPILSDVTTIRSGIVLKVTQSTPATLPTGKKDSADASAMTFTMKDVVLSGKDYTTSIKLSYAERKMSQGAMEEHLVKEISDAISEQIAKAVFTSIITDAAANSCTKGSTDTYFKTIGVALGKAKLANNPVIYANSADYYAILMETDSNGQPIVREGVVLGAQLKKDNAATKITIVDPAEYVLNFVEGVGIRTADDVENAKLIIGGYARAEGCLRKINAAAFIA